MLGGLENGMEVNNNTEQDFSCLKMVPTREETILNQYSTLNILDNPHGIGEQIILNTNWTKWKI